MKFVALVCLLLNLGIEETQTHSTECICTTVPCPVNGNNSLTEGGGSTGVYHYITHSGFPVVGSASATITLKDDIFIIRELG